MTSTRGRALVINNRYGDVTARGSGRRGSPNDYKHMTNMLQRFGFIISHLSCDRDWQSDVSCQSLTGLASIVVFQLYIVK